MNMCSVEQIIASTGFCLHEEIQDLVVMKTGMTNRSYSFFAKGIKYIIRIPGEGTQKLINRYWENDTYTQLKKLDISEHVHYFNPETGVKIASYIENSRPCDAQNADDIRLCMTALRCFHDQKLSVDHQFDLWGQIEYYEALLDGQASCYGDYHTVKEAVLELRCFIEKQDRDCVLCHIDSVPDNFLIEEKNGSLPQVRLVDWEYAGMQDPHLDIAMFIVYSMFDRDMADGLIDAYFTEGCSHLTRMKIYCYIAASGLLWSNWCEYKRKLGVEFGCYAQRQYEYAKEYTAYFHNEYERLYNVTWR